MNKPLIISVIAPKGMFSTYEITREIIKAFKRNYKSIDIVEIEDNGYWQLNSKAGINEDYTYYDLTDDFMGIYTLKTVVKVIEVKSDILIFNLSKEGKETERSNYLQSICTMIIEADKDKSFTDIMNGLEKAIKK